MGEAAISTSAMQRSWCYRLDGLLDDIRIYNRAFSAEDVMTLYAFENPTEHEPRDLPDRDFVGQWRIIADNTGKLASVFTLLADHTAKKRRVLAASLHEIFWWHCERGCFPYLGGPPWLDEGVATYRHRWHVDEIAVRFGVGHGKRELGFQTNVGR